MNERQLAAAYTDRAAEYIERFASTDKAHPEDQGLIGTWARGVGGRVLDAGCGPGHWADYLCRLGIEVTGIDLVPEFVAHAREACPGADFAVGSLSATGLPDDSFAGILAWYSLIHANPVELMAALGEFRRLLVPGGSLLIGFFEGPAAAQFEHKVATAYQWPVDSMVAHAAAAGFEEVERVTRTGPGHRPHGALVARVGPTPPA